MKTFSTILKILAAIALIAGIIFIIARYGDQIVAWCKKMFAKVKGLLAKKGCNCVCDDDFEDCHCCCEAAEGEAVVEAEDQDFAG